MRIMDAGGALVVALGFESGAAKAATAQATAPASWIEINANNTDGGGTFGLLTESVLSLRKVARGGARTDGKAHPAAAPICEGDAGGLAGLPWTIEWE